MSETAPVTTTIVLYNSAGELNACLAALREGLDAGLTELVAVDNASPDDSAAIVRAAVPGARIIRSADNRGFAAGCNQAWPFVAGRYWLLLNPDAELEPGTLEKLVGFMDAHRHVAAVSPWLRDAAGGDLIFPGRAFPSIGRALIELTRMHRALPKRVRARVLQGPYVSAGQPDPPRPDWVPGTVMLVRREAIDAVGLLDEGFFLYGEDLDWCWRMRRTGWDIAVCDGAVARHHARASGERTWSGDIVEERIASGVVRAIARVRGAARARAFAALVAAAHAVEASHPRRDPQTRAAAASAARGWWEAVRRA